MLVNKTTSQNSEAVAISTLFIGGGNMASAIVGGMVRGGVSASSIGVIDPGEETCERLRRDFGVQAWPGLREAQAALGAACDFDLVVWAVKPQVFTEAAQGLALLESGATFCMAFRNAVQLSVMAGVTTKTLSQTLSAPRVVRAMPNTPALIGRGMTGLYALPSVDNAGRQLVEAVLTQTGELLWFDNEASLDAVTALSGSGPAYVFYFLEAMVQAGEALGLDAGDAKSLALATFAGATELAAQTSEPLSTLRERVTSKGGTTHAAISVMESARLSQTIQEAVFAAHHRAEELGRTA